MICSHCNKRIDDNSKFCPQCGAKVEHSRFDYQNNGLSNHFWDLFAPHLENLVEAMTTDSDGNEGFCHPSLFWNALYTPYFVVANTAKKKKDIKCFENFFLHMNEIEEDCFTESGEELCNDLDEELEKASMTIIFECVELVKKVSQLTGKSFLNIYDFRGAAVIVKKFYAEHLEDEIFDLKEYIESQADLFPELLDSLNDLQNYVAENNFPSKPLFKELGFEVVDCFPPGKPLYNTFKMHALEQVQAVEGMLKAVSLFDSGVSKTTLSVLKNSKFFREMYLTVCERLMKRGARSEQIIQAIYDRIEMHETIGVWRSVSDRLKMDSPDFAMSVMSHMYWGSVRCFNPKERKEGEKIASIMETLADSEERLFFPSKNTPTVDELLDDIIEKTSEL